MDGIEGADLEHSIVQLSGEDTQRCRLLFADQLNLARGKYVPLSEARKGHARLCVGAYAVTYCKDMIAAPGAGVLDGLPDMELVFDPEELRPSWEDNTRIVVGDLRDPLRDELAEDAAPGAIR